MKIRLLVIGIFISCFSTGYAQQDPAFSQTMSTLTLINPGSAGSEDKICLHAAHREQWVGFDGAPSTSLFSANGAFSFFGADHGVGLTFLNDAYGFNTDLGINLAYAYRLDLANGKLGLGINLGIVNKALGPGWIDVEG